MSDPVSDSIHFGPNGPRQTPRRRFVGKNGLQIVKEMFDSAKALAPSNFFTFGCAPLYQ